MDNTSGTTSTQQPRLSKNINRRRSNSAEAAALRTGVAPVSSLAEGSPEQHVGSSASTPAAPTAASSTNAQAENRSKAKNRRLILPVPLIRIPCIEPDPNQLVRGRLASTPADSELIEAESAQLRSGDDRRPDSQDGSVNQEGLDRIQASEPDANTMPQPPVFVQSQAPDVPPAMVRRAQHATSDGDSQTVVRGVEATGTSNERKKKLAIEIAFQLILTAVLIGVLLLVHAVLTGRFAQLGTRSDSLPETIPGANSVESNAPDSSAGESLARSEWGEQSEDPTRLPTANQQTASLPNGRITGAEFDRAIAEPSSPRATIESQSANAAFGMGERTEVALASNRNGLGPDDNRDSLDGDRSVQLVGFENDTPREGAQISNGETRVIEPSATTSGRLRWPGDATRTNGRNESTNRRPATELRGPLDEWSQSGARQ